MENIIKTKIRILDSVVNNILNNLKLNEDLPTQLVKHIKAHDFKLIATDGIPFNGKEYIVTIPYKSIDIFSHKEITTTLEICRLVYTIGIYAKNYTVYLKDLDSNDIYSKISVRQGNWSDTFTFKIVGKDPLNF